MAGSRPKEPRKPLDTPLDRAHRGKLKGCDKVFKEKRSGVDAGRPELKACLEYLREGDTLLVTKLDRLARSTTDLYRIVSQLTERGVTF
jgi:DNA invertase Pin-like site-specific DNA recombinase